MRWHMCDTRFSSIVVKERQKEERQNKEYWYVVKKDYWLVIWMLFSTGLFSSFPLETAALLLVLLVTNVFATS